MLSCLLLRLALFGGDVALGLAPAASSESVRTRRSLLHKGGVATAGVAFIASSGGLAAVAAEDALVVKGVVSLGEGVSLPSSGDAALYITVKRGAQPQRVAGLVRGTPDPPLGAVRVALKDIKSFPYSFEVRQPNVFADAPAFTIGASALTVSLRLDDDGIAATRGAEDLVGSTFVYGTEDCLVDLKSRGSAVKQVMKQ